MADKSKYDVKGTKTLLGIDSDDGEVRSLKVEADVGALHTSGYVWDTGTLSNVRMIQPLSDVTDLEDIASGIYWKAIRFDWDANENPIYKGFHTTVNAATDDTNWYITKTTWDVNDNPTYIQGPLVGAWDNRTGLGW